MIKTLLKWVLAIFVLFVLYALNYVFAVNVIISEYFSHEQAPNLDFEFHNCFSGPSRNPQEVKSLDWQNGKLQIEANLTPNCGTTWVYGNYELEGDKIELQYTSILSTAYGCLCDIEAVYEIEGLEQRDYKISIKETKWVFQDLYWLF